MKILKIYDCTAETHTHIIIENVMTLARNYVTNYKPEHLNHIASQITVSEQGIITDKGEIILAENKIEKRLDDILEMYEEYTIENYHNMEK